ncbi:MAG: GspMb/PilO family protein [Thermoanaerobaculales bacterium]
MTVDVRPWQRLLAAWLPAVVVCVAAAGFYIWQTSETGGNRVRVREGVVTLEAKLDRLESLREMTARDRESVAEVDQQLTVLYDEIFAGLEERLTRILRAVGSATRNAGLLPGSYSYTAKKDRKTGYIRFGVQFSVAGEYGQLRQMLAELQSSPELLVVEGLSLVGDQDAVSHDLRISVSIATFLSEADEEQLRRLTGGLGRSSGEDVG